jgi:hypothetical protein
LEHLHAARKQVDRELLSGLVVALREGVWLIVKKGV